MWHVLHLIARPTEVLLGVFCVLSAIVLYPGEEGKIQSKFEDFWIRVDDYQKLALSRHAAFMTQVAKLESRLLDGVFGHKLISRRAITFSVLISIASLLTTWSFTETDSSGAITFELHDFVGFVFGGSVVLAIYLVVGSILFYGARFVWNNQSKGFVGGLLILSIVTLYIFIQSVGFAESQGIRISGFSLFEFAAVALAGFTCDVLFIVTTRRLIRWAGEMTNSFKVCSVVILNLLLAAVLICPLPLFHSYSENELGVAFLFSVGVTNLWDSSLALFFVFLALCLLLHRVVWPLLTRTLFRMTDIGTKGRRAILTTVGLALLAAGISGKVPELLQKLIERLGG
jgi:hypothetical protein